MEEFSGKKSARLAIAGSYYPLLTSNGYKSLDFWLALVAVKERRRKALYFNHLPVCLSVCGCSNNLAVDVWLFPCLCCMCVCVIQLGNFNARAAMAMRIYACSSRVRSTHEWYRLARPMDLDAAHLKTRARQEHSSGFLTRSPNEIRVYLYFVSAIVPIMRNFFPLSR